MHIFMFPPDRIQEKGEKDVVWLQSWAQLDTHFLWLASWPQSPIRTVSPQPQMVDDPPASGVGRDPERFITRTAGEMGGGQWNGN